MSVFIDNFFSTQVNSFRNKLTQSPGLDLLSRTGIGSLSMAEGKPKRERLFSPAVTLWIFISQVLSEEHSCHQAVSRFAAFLISQGRRPCSTITSSYCRARKRLSETFLTQAVTQSSRWLENEVAPIWWKERSVKIVDGCTVGMADTDANQNTFPQVKGQKPGLGFPIARLCCVFSLASGAAIGMAMGAYRGKGNGETSLFRTLFSALNDKDIVLGDRYFCSYWIIALLGLIKVDFVFRLHQKRKTDGRNKLGKNDWLIKWKRQKLQGEVDLKTYHRFDPFVCLRLIKISTAQKGYRTRKVYIVTSLLDPTEFSVSDLSELYRLRWNIEGDIRTLKHTMQMDFLRCRTPEMVRKEVWVHLLGYNLTRILMAEAAKQKGILPRTLSFTAALNALRSAEMLLLFTEMTNLQIYTAILPTLLSHRVSNRPGRNEPRELKFRRRGYQLLTKPRRKLPRFNNAVRN